MDEAVKTAVSPVTPEGPQLTPDQVTQHIVVGCLGSLVILCAVSCTLLPLFGHEIPPSIPALGGTAIGTLTGLLAATRRTG